MVYQPEDQDHPGGPQDKYEWVSESFKYSIVVKYSIVYNQLHNITFVTFYIFAFFIKNKKQKIWKLTKCGHPGDILTI